MSIIGDVRNALRNLMKEKGDIVILATTRRVYKISEVLKELSDEISELYEVFNVRAEALNIEKIYENVLAFLKSSAALANDVEKPEKILMTRPHYEQATEILYNWQEPLVSAIRSAGIPLVELDGPSDTRSNFTESVKEVDTVYIFGHGNWTQIAGHDNEIILDSNNVEILKGKQTFVLACMAARVLGIEAVAKGGADFFYGYKKTFVFTAPPYDNIFAEVALYPFFKALNGGSIEKIYGLQCLKYLEAIGKIPQEMAIIILPVLIWDLSALEVRNPL